MSKYSLSHVSDAALLRDLAALVTRDRATTAELLAHIAEVDARKLYRPAAHPSMFSYCVGELRLSEDVAYKRIQAARAAREFPGIFGAAADGRLHLTAVVMLAPHLTRGNAGELIAAATHRSKAGVEQLLAERFPRPDLPEQVTAVPAPVPGAELVPEPVTSPGTSERQLVPEPVGSQGSEPKLDPGQVERAVPERVESRAAQRLAPLAPQRYALQLTVSQETHDKLRYAQELLGHQLPSGDLAQILDQALDALICQLEKRKFAATSEPRESRHPTRSARHIPAAVKRAVRERDQGQCTFRSESGRRCPARTRLEFDHVEPVARGGQATVDGIRLRCRSHNQYDAECTFGAGFMERKREEAREAAAAKRRQAAREVTRWKPATA
jgi:hypothetical protein